MNRIHVLSLILGVVIVGALSVPVFAQSDTNEIPSWIKGVANFWIEGGINDTEFIEALEFLIDSDIIKLGENTGNDLSELQKEYDILKERYDEQEQVWKKSFQGETGQRERIVQELEQELSELKERSEKQRDQLIYEFDEALEDIKKRYNESRSMYEESDLRRGAEVDRMLEENREFKTTVEELEWIVNNLERENTDLKLQLEAQ